MAVKLPGGTVRIVRPRDDAAAEAFVRLLFGPLQARRFGATDADPRGVGSRFENRLTAHWHAMLFRD